MAALADYLRRLREQQKPQPAPEPDAEIIEKAEAYDIIVGGAEDEAN